MAKGRKFSTSQPLGRIMAEQQVTASWVSGQSGVHPRTLSEYLSGRVKIKHDHALVLAEVLGVDPNDIHEVAKTPVTGRDLLHQQPIN